MQLTIAQDDLLRALRIVNRAVPSRATLPITQNVLIETEDGGIKVSATDLSLSIRTWTVGQVYETGSITLPARALLDTINSFPLGRVNIDSTEDSSQVKITTEAINTMLHGSSPEEYPPFPEVSKKHSTQVDSLILSNALDRTVFAAALDDARPVLTGVLMEVKGSKATFVAADGFRLSIEVAQLMQESQEPFLALIPSRAMAELTSLIHGTVSPVEITVAETGGEAMFRIGDNVEVITQLIAGTYPDYNALVPKDIKTTLTIPIAKIKQLVRPMQVVAREGSAALRMIASKNDEQGELVLRASAEDFGTSEAAMKIGLEGEDNKIAFNVKFISELMAHLQGGSSNPIDEDTTEEESLIVELNTPSSPVVFKHSNYTDFRHVVMPLYVQW